MSPVHIVGDGAVPFVKVLVGDGGVLPAVDHTIRTVQVGGDLLVGVQLQSGVPQ